MGESTRVELRFQTPLKHPTVRLLLRKNLALKPRDSNIAGKPSIWRKIRFQTTLRKKLLAIKPFVNSYLWQQEPVTAHTINHQTVPSNQNIFSQIEGILHPDRFHDGEHSRL